MTATLLPRVTAPVLIAAPMPAITPQPSSPTAAGSADGSTLVHWPEWTSVFSMNAPMPSAGRQLGAVLERHLLGGVVGGEAVPRLAAQAGPAVAADRAPVEDHEVARRDVGDALADRLDDAGRLVAEQERELVVDAALAVVQVGVADPAGLHLHHGLARAGVGDVDGLDRDRLRPWPWRPRRAPAASSTPRVRRPGPANLSSTYRARLAWPSMGCADAAGGRRRSGRGGARPDGGAPRLGSTVAADAGGGDGRPAGVHGGRGHQPRRRTSTPRRSRWRSPQQPAYIGGDGVARTPGARREWLLAHGVTEAELATVHGPAGLDIGADTPAEIALSILAELVATVRGATISRLAQRPGRPDPPRPPARAPRSARPADRPAGRSDGQPSPTTGRAAPRRRRLPVRRARRPQSQSTSAASAAAEPPEAGPAVEERLRRRGPGRPAPSDGSRSPRRRSRACRRRASR